MLSDGNFSAYHHSKSDPYIKIRYINCQIPYNTKLSRLHGKLLFHHKKFSVAHGGPKDYACDGDY